MARVDLGWQGGRRRFKAIYGKSRKEVANALRDALKAAEQGTLVTDERQTIAEFLAQWLSDVARIRLRPRTFDGYESTIQNHINPHIGRFRLTKLTPQQLQTWMGELERKGVSANRRRYARVVLRNALNTAVKWRLVTVNVSTLIDAPRTVKRETRVLMPDEAKALLVACRNHPLEAFVTVALGCGLRLGEALGLRWTDIDLDAGTLSIQRAIQRFGGSAAVRRPFLAQRKRLLQAFRIAEKADTEGRQKLITELQAVREELAKLKTQVHFTEPKSLRSR